MNGHGLKRTAIRCLLSVFAFLVCVPAFLCCADDPSAPETTSRISLPPPVLEGTVSLEEVIHSRRSVRSFQDRPLTLPEISQLLWAAGGKTIDGLTGATRSCPSAGGIYPLFVYLVAGRVAGLPSGLYRYEWKDHALVMLQPGDQRFHLTDAAYGQPWVASAPTSIVITADISRTASRYGERGEKRYVPMDAGHAGQNVSLQARALGLGSVIVGAFDDSRVGDVLGVKKETPLYIIPVGWPVP
ncbi:MAG: SagB/ThcOx family dehydrogenase [PVC group bacterium]